MKRNKKGSDAVWYLIIAYVIALMGVLRFLRIFGIRPTGFIPSLIVIAGGFVFVIIGKLFLRGDEYTTTEDVIRTGGNPVARFVRKRLVRGNAMQMLEKTKPTFIYRIRKVFFFVAALSFIASGVLFCREITRVPDYMYFNATITDVKKLTNLEYEVYYEYVLKGTKYTNSSVTYCPTEYDIPKVNDLELIYFEVKNPANLISEKQYWEYKDSLHSEFILVPLLIGAYSLIIWLTLFIVEAVLPKSKKVSNDY